MQLKTKSLKSDKKDEDLCSRIPLRVVARGAKLAIHDMLWSLVPLVDLAKEWAQEVRGAAVQAVAAHTSKMLHDASKHAGGLAAARASRRP